MIDGFLLVAPMLILLLFLLYRFVGCEFHPGSAQSSIIAYWPLNEPGTTPSGGTATDAQGTHDGTYVALAGPPQTDPQSAFPTLPLDGVPPGGFR